MIRRVVLLAAVLVPAAAPASAVSPGTLSFGAPCYYVGNQISATGSGWTPNDRIALTASSPKLSVTALAEASGTFSSSFTAPDLPGDGPLVRHVTATAADRADSSNTTTASFFLVQPAVDANLNGHSQSVVQWTIAGFTGGKTVYGHWVFKHRSRKTLTMGKVPGACGLVKHRAPRIPVASQIGTWTAQFDTSKTWHSSTPNVAVEIRVLPGR